MKFLEHKQINICVAVLATLFFLQSCAVQTGVKSFPPKPSLMESLSDQFTPLSTAVRASGLKHDFFIIQIPSANNEISNRMMTLWGMEGSLADVEIQGFIKKGFRHFCVVGKSSAVNVSAVRAALKAASPVSHPIDIFVFVGDFNPVEPIHAPTGIKVHFVRKDGSEVPL